MVNEKGDSSQSISTPLIRAVEAASSSLRHIPLMHIFYALRQLRDNAFSVPSILPLFQRANVIYQELGDAKAHSHFFRGRTDASETVQLVKITLASVW
jgi:hypothetical protein